jgi:hypothetical protein
MGATYMLRNSCPGGTLAEEAGEQFWFGCLLNPSLAFRQICLASPNRQGDLDCCATSRYHKYSNAHFSAFSADPIETTTYEIFQIPLS